MNWFSTSLAAALSLGTALASASEPAFVPLTVARNIPTHTVRLKLTADRIQKISPADPKSVPAGQFIVIHQPRVALSERFTFVDNVEVSALPFLANEEMRTHVCKAYGFGRAFSVVGYDLNSAVNGFHLALLEKEPGRVGPANSHSYTIQQVTCLP